MNNQIIIDELKLDNAVITLETRESKKGTYFQCVVLTYNGKSEFISFDIKLFNKLKKNLKKGEDK